MNRRHTRAKFIYLVVFSWLLIVSPIFFADLAHSGNSSKRITFASDERKWMLDALHEPLVPLPRGPSTGFTLANDPSHYIYFFSSLEYKHKSKIKGFPYSYELLTRSAGYLEAIEKLWSERTLDEHPSHWPEGTTVRDKIEGLTGIRFDNKRELRQWFLEHVHYLIWSEQEKRLVVDQKAFQAKKHIHYFFHSEWDRGEPAENFWLLKLDGSFNLGWRVGDYIKGELVGMHGQMEKYKFHVSVLNDLEAKEKVYKNALEEADEKIKHDVKNYPEGIQRNFNTISRKHLYRIKQITGQNFKTVKEWLNWYGKHKDRLTLSRDGDRLVPGNQ